MISFKNLAITLLLLSGWCVSAANAQITISPPAADIHINGHTYTNSNWQANPSGTLSAVANDVGQVTQAYPQGKFSPRVVLTSDLTLYVDPGGNDANNCLVGNACRTLQHVYDILRDKYDLSGFKVTVQAAPGTYTTGLVISQQLVGQKGPSQLVFQGSLSSGNIDNYLIRANQVTEIDTLGSAVSAVNTGSFTLYGFKVENNGGGGGISAYIGGVIFYGFINFGSAGTTAGACQIVANQHGETKSIDATWISGSAFCHFGAYVGGANVASGPSAGAPYLVGVLQNVTMTFFADVGSSGVLYAAYNTFTLFGATLTATRYQVRANATILVNGAGATFFPGTAPGFTASNGVYE